MTDSNPLPSSPTKPWGDYAHSASPECPHCHEEISDSPFEDFGVSDGVFETECGNCGEPVEVEANVSVMWRARGVR